MTMPEGLDPSIHTREIVWPATERTLLDHAPLG